MPFLSIIIPTFNASRFVQRSLLSIVNQSFKDYELIIQDGISKDDTIVMIYEIKLLYPHIKMEVVSEKDEGVYDAMNKAVKRASGQWLYFLGSDDYLLNVDVFQKFFDSVKEDYCRHQIVYGNVTSPFMGEKYAGEFDKSKILVKNICHQAIFYNREVFTQLGSYNLRYKYLADYDFNLRCFYNKQIRTRYIDLMIAYYEVGGISNTHKDEAFYEDYPNPASFVKKFAYKDLPLRVVWNYCSSLGDFVLLLLKRFFYSFS